jgi:hypothetical protein
MKKTTISTLMSLWLLGASPAWAQPATDAGPTAATAPATFQSTPLWPALKCEPPARLEQTLEMQVEGVQVTGGCDASQVDVILKKRTNAMRYCGQRLHVKGKPVALQVLLSWTFGPTGATQVIEASASGESPEILENCLKTQIRRWLYTGTSPTGLCTARWTLRFHASDFCAAGPPSNPTEPQGGFH